MLSFLRNVIMLEIMLAVDTNNKLFQGDQIDLFSHV